MLVLVVIKSIQPKALFFIKVVRLWFCGFMLFSAKVKTTTETNNLYGLLNQLEEVEHHIDLYNSGVGEADATLEAYLQYKHDLLIEKLTHVCYGSNVTVLNQFA